MKNIFYSIIILLGVILSNCGVSGTEEKLKKHLIDSLVAEQLSKKMESILGKEDEECKKLINDTLFKGLFKAFCPNDTMQGIPISLHKKFPFDTLITKKQDTVVYSFKVSNECCMKYYGAYNLNADTLIINYNFCGSPCDCYCDYILTCKIPKKKYNYKYVVLRTKEYLSFNTN